MKDMFAYSTLKPFNFLGVEHSFFDVHIDTLIYTWIAMVFLIGGGLIGRYFMRKEYNPEIKSLISLRGNS